MPLDLTQLSQITEPLLAWYEKNARVLPWRENTDAYRVWVSEIMLQQTRVDTVIPYYERFLRRFPDVAALAAAPEQELLKMWEGLGYYSRVRNMQKAAQQICEKYNGIFPDEYEQLLSLPGIGAYTAGAVASIAWNKPYAAVDGNVLRVVTRLTADSREISDTKFKNEITAALQEIYPVDKCGIFTQSLMELGAVVCMPNGTPRCTECPLQSLCSACAAGTQPAYPVKKKKAQLETAISNQVKNLREADENLKRFIQDDVKGLTDELSETETLLQKLEDTRQSQMYAVRDIEEIKERLLSFEIYAKDAQPDVLVTLIQSFVERIYIVDENDERYCHIFIKGCTKEDYDEFFRATGYISGTRETGTITSKLPLCDSDECCKHYMVLAIPFCMC